MSSNPFSDTFSNVVSVCLLITVNRLAHANVRWLIQVDEQIIDECLHFIANPCQPVFSVQIYHM